nr:hypothetical protein [Angustibacter aerolatus]
MSDETTDARQADATYGPGARSGCTASRAARLTGRTGASGDGTIRRAERLEGSTAAPTLFENPGLPAHVHRMADTDPRAAKRAERQVAAMFFLSMVATLLFLVSYFAVDPDTRTFVPLIGPTKPAEPAARAGSRLRPLLHRHRCGPLGQDADARRGGRRGAAPHPQRRPRPRRDGAHGHGRRRGQRHQAPAADQDDAGRCARSLRAAVHRGAARPGPAAGRPAVQDDVEGADAPGERPRAWPPSRPRTSPSARSST